MNWQRLVSPAHVEPWRNNASELELHADTLALRPAATRVDITIDGRDAADDQVARPVQRMYSIAALQAAVWIVPDGDDWVEVYGDGDGWPVWDVEIWTPAVGYGDSWAVPNGDGWSPYGSNES